MAQSYDRQGKKNNAEYALIEYFKATGDMQKAKMRAGKLLPKISKTSITYQKLKDILETEVE